MHIVLGMLAIVASGVISGALELSGVSKSWMYWLLGALGMLLACWLWSLA